jgi:hypothetical protein
LVIGKAHFFHLQDNDIWNYFSCGKGNGKSRLPSCPFAGLKVCILGKACLAPIQPILVAQVTTLGANIYFGDEQINIFRSTVLLENIF